MKVITISGKAQNGKDTFAEYLKKEFEKSGKKVIIIHFADVLKFCAEKYFLWDGKKDAVGRSLLQYLGTDLARVNNNGVWARIVSELLKSFQSEFDFALIPDCRFEDEIEITKSNFDTTTMKIIRNNFKSPLSVEQQNHPSETSLDHYDGFDVVLYIGEGLENSWLSAYSFVKKNTSE